MTGRDHGNMEGRSPLSFHPQAVSLAAVHRKPKDLPALPQGTFHRQRKQARVGENVVLHTLSTAMDNLISSMPLLARRSLLALLPGLESIGPATAAPQCPVHVSAMPPEFPGSAHAVFGFGVAGVHAAKAAAAACSALRSHEDPGWLTELGGMLSGPDVAETVLAARWSFSVLCCDASDDRATAQASAAARNLSSRGHMAILLVVGPSSAPLASCMGARHGRYQPARLLLPVPDDRDSLVPVLAVSAATLLSSIVCRGLVSLDATDIWSAIGGPRPCLAIHAAANRGQQPADFGQSVVLAACAAGMRGPSVRRLAINVLMPPAWRLHELDAVATTIAKAFDNADVAVLPAIHDPAADTASVLLVGS
ncbi:hypothetical protein ACFQS7_14835 [Dankookia sp. GCM10030260]|uniref:hypothetical protein n=1 Tax=Dankookia sp. GCM10030260 TaxID=3273390 RepID=UPI003617AA60